MRHPYFTSHIELLGSKYLSHKLTLPLLPHSSLEVPKSKCLTRAHKQVLCQSMELQLSSSLALTSSSLPSLTQLSKKLHQVTTALSVVTTGSSPSLMSYEQTAHRDQKDAMFSLKPSNPTVSHGSVMLTPLPPSLGEGF